MKKKTCPDCKGNGTAGVALEGVDFTYKITKTPL